MWPLCAMGLRLPGCQHAMLQHLAWVLPGQLRHQANGFPSTVWSPLLFSPQPANNNMIDFGLYFICLNCYKKNATYVYTYIYTCMYHACLHVHEAYPTPSGAPVGRSPSASVPALQVGVILGRADARKRNTQNLGPD